MIQKSILSVPYNGDLNWFAYPLGGYTYLSDEDQVQVYICLPWDSDPDDVNGHWYKVLDQFDPHDP